MELSSGYFISQTYTAQLRRPAWSSSITYISFLFWVRLSAGLDFHVSRFVNLYERFLPLLPCSLYICFRFAFELFWIAQFEKPRFRSSVAQTLMFTPYYKLDFWSQRCVRLLNPRIPLKYLMALKYILVNQICYNPGLDFHISLRDLLPAESMIYQHMKR